MKSRMRALLLWVMVLALPAQALAASLMLFCGPSHQRMVPGFAAGHPASMTVHVHEHELAAPAPAHGARVPDAAAAAVGGAAGADGFGAAPLGDLSCSACAACCTVLAPPADFALPAAPEPGHAFVPVAGAAVPSHHPDRLDRPPRAVSA
jgi:hypothetical protein